MSLSIQCVSLGGLHIQMSDCKWHICNFGYYDTIPGYWKCVLVFNFDGFSKIKCHIVNATFVVFSHISRELGMCRSALSSIFMQILKLLMLCLGSPGFFWSFSGGLILVKIFSGAQLPLQPGSWATSVNHFLMTIYHSDPPHHARNVIMMVFIKMIIIIFLTIHKNHWNHCWANFIPPHFQSFSTIFCSTRI